MTYVVRTLAVSLVAVFAVAGCGGGGGGGESTTEWADGVCSAITDWSESISNTAKSLQGGNLSSEAVSSAVDDFQSATSEFVDTLKGLGEPDTESGEQAKELLDQLANDVDEGVANLESDVSGSGGVVAAATAVSTTLSTMGSQLTSTFSELEQLDAAGELEDAFREADSCDALGSDGS